MSVYTLVSIAGWTATYTGTREFLPPGPVGAALAGSASGLGVALISDRLKITCFPETYSHIRHLPPTTLNTRIFKSML
ncbi:hypothetical protein HDU92_008515, partial [Lobulomyces angularis]